MQKSYFVYILTNANHTVFYVGVTNDLFRRICEHQGGAMGGFTKRYNVTKLVYFEENSDINAVIQREKTIKKWKRSIKIDAINRLNPTWKDLYGTLFCSTEGDAATCAA